MPLPAEFPLWNSDEIDDAVKIRQDEKRKLDLELSQLFNRRNTLQPISRLPEELLAAIFLQYHADAIADLYDSHPAPIAYHGMSPDWLKLGAVCRRWREIFLSYPPLWSDIKATSFQWLELSTERSQQSPLQIRIAHLPWSSFLRVYASVLKNSASRVRSLAMWLPMSGTRSNAKSAALPASNDCVLHSLEILRIHIGHGWATNHISASLQPLNGDSQPYSNLKTLECGGVPWTFVRAALRHSLTVLKVSTPHSAPFANEWIEVLKALPELKELMLRRAIGDIHPEGPQALSGTVCLPHLNTLTLSSLSTSECPFYVNLWNHLQLPQLSHTHVDLESTMHIATETFQRWLVPKYTAVDSDKPYVAARFAWSPVRIFGRSLIPTFYNPTLGLSSSPIPTLPIGTSRYLDKTSQTFCTSFAGQSEIQAIIETLPLARVTTFAIEYDLGWMTLAGTLPHVWNSFALKMTNVTTMYISNAIVVVGFLGMLRRAARPAAAVDGLEFFPNLKHLELTGICWASDTGTMVEETHDNGGWIDLPNCPCDDLVEVSGCSCLPLGQDCSCTIGTICDCECRWVKEKFNKLVVEALRWRNQSRGSRLQHLDLLTSTTENIAVPPEYNEEVLKDLVGELNIQFA